MVIDRHPRLNQAARALYFEQRPDGFLRRFPADSRYLDRAYESLELHVEEIISQESGESPLPWGFALKELLRRLEGQGLQWRLVGSAALAACGLAVEPGDIDLFTDAKSAHRLADLILDALVEPVRSTKDWVGDWFGRAYLRACIDWGGADDPAVDAQGVTDFGPAAAARLEAVA